MHHRDTSYHYSNGRTNPSHAYLFPVIEQVIAGFRSSSRRAIDVGCGNGCVSDFLAGRGFEVVGVDPSQKGIEIARRTFPRVQFHQGDAYEDLQGSFGHFDLSVSLEVVEHLYSPRSFAKTLFSVTKPGGQCLVSTPYHGYWKNLSLALLGRMDGHHNPLREGGHIKFFSEPQLKALLEDAGFHVTKVVRVGRVPPVAKSMIAIAERRNTK